MLRRLSRRAVACTMVASVGLVGAVATSGTAAAAPEPAEDATSADAVQSVPGAQNDCYTWDRTLSEGDTGNDVTELQIRVAGYPGNGQVLAIDGVFGPHTAQAVTRFQQAYGLSADGVAGPETYGQIYSLQSADCSPANFTFAELNSCNSDWSGGAVSASQARENAKRTMWKLQAMRQAMGSAPLVISSGFRSVPCNNAVGGATNSRHLYGDAADLVGNHSFCDLARQARNHGFNGILGPGFPGHDDHTHVDHRSSRYWDAPTCGI